MLSGTDLPCFRRYRGRSSAKRQRWRRMISPSCGELVVLAMGGLQGRNSELHHNLRAVPTERLNMPFNPAQSKAFCKDVIITEVLRAALDAYDPKVQDFRLFLRKLPDHLGIQMLIYIQRN